MENEKLFEFMEKMYVEMQGGFKSVDVRLDKMDGRLDKMDGRLDRLEAGQISLENRLEDTRKTLFAGYIQTTEKLTMLDNKIDHLQIDVNNLSMKTINNDTRIIEISQELKRAK
jgi:chaperonin cofactor prefoldin